MRFNKSLFKNFTWLTISQGANFLIPLIVYPYLLRVLDLEKFGLVVFAQAVVMYFVYIVDYGFSITAVREVSIHRNDRKRLSGIFTQLYITKFALLIISLAVFYLLIMMMGDWYDQKILFLTSFTIVVGQLLLPIWWFQGMEKMNGVAAVNITSKILFAALILLLINENQDYKWVNLYLGASQVLVGLVSVVLIFLNYKINIQLPDFHSLKRQLKENLSIFTSVFAGFVSGNSNLIILGVIADPVSIGYYGIVEKILLAIKAPAVILYQTVFPKVCMLAEQSFGDLLHFLKSVTRLTFISFVSLGIVVIFFADEIVYLFAGQYLDVPASLLKIVSFIPLLAALNIPACQTMLAYNFKSSYAKVTVSGALLNIILNIILVTVFSAYGAAITALITELFITTSLFLYLALFHQKHSVIGVFKTSSLKNE